MLFCLIATIILGVIIGFADFSQGAFFRGLGGQIMQGVLSIACFTLVGAAFWRLDWKIGVLDFIFAIIAANVRLIREKKTLSGSSECLRASEYLTIPRIGEQFFVRNACYSSECFTSEHFTLTWNKWSNSPFRHIIEFCNNSRRNALRFPRITCQSFIH